MKPRRRLAALWLPLMGIALGVLLYLGYLALAL